MYPIIEIITSIFLESIFGRIIFKLIRVIKLGGFFVLRLIIINTRSMEEVKEKYTDSSLPYFLGFGMAFGIIYLLIWILKRLL